MVDDEPEFSELLQFRLQHLNYEVLAANNSTDGLNKARSELPDAILLDLLLPDFDGLTLCEILRRDIDTRGTPIILITAVTSEATQYAARVGGACGFLGKPLDFERLREMLKSIFAAKPSSNNVRERQHRIPIRFEQPAAYAIRTLQAKHL